MYLNWGVRRHRWIVPPAVLVGCSFQSTLQHVRANFRGVILQLYWFSTALISRWRFKLLKALSRITLNLGQKKTGGILSDSKDVILPWDTVWAASLQCSVTQAAFFHGSHGSSSPRGEELSLTADSKMLFIIKLEFTSKLFPADIPSVAEGTLHPIDVLGPLGKVSRL